MGVRLPGWGREDEERVAAAAAEKAGSKSSNGSGSAHGHSHGHHGGYHFHNPLATSKWQSGSKSRDVDPSSCHVASTSNDGAGDLSADALDCAGGHVAGPPDAGPWPAAFHAAFYAQACFAPPPRPRPRPPTKRNGWPLPSMGGMDMGGNKGWMSDSGWGCKLRTSQSLLATALGRVGTPTAPFPPPTRPAHAQHARLLSWFLDAPAAPFGVHRMALAGKAAGKDVGMWFGLSAAAGALRTLADAFPAAGLGVSVATDGTLYQTEVFAASHSSIAASVSSHASHGRGSPSGHSKGGKDAREKMWGYRPVLLLLGIRLGLDGMNPICYGTITIIVATPTNQCMLPSINI
ncbi:hypothetical protein B0H10DRAFT_2441493 [Mycena sp. CBHHK59/15]|nr:hypothetical protein B0H10DRAFT_2441493 [Mycena sp. CBHHK59/15]